MKKYSLILLCLIGLAYSSFFVSNKTLGQNINPLDQWTSTTSPISAITQRIYGKSLRLTGLENQPCLGTNSSGVVGAGTCGGGSGSSFGEAWTIVNNIFSQSSLTPTTTKNIAVNGTGTSTFVGGVESWRQISAPYFQATSTTLNKFGGNIQVGTTNASPLLQTGGSEADPAFSFVGDPDTGVFRQGTNSLGFSTSGTLRGYFDGSGVLNLVNGLVSQASSTFVSSVRLPSLSQGLSYIGSTGLVNSTGTTTLVAGTNVSFSGGTPVILGSSPVTINSSGGGGSGTVSSGLAGQLGFYDTTGTTIVGTSTAPLYVGGIVATSTTVDSYIYGTLRMPNLLGTQGLLKADQATNRIRFATVGTDYLIGSGTSGNCTQWGASNGLTDSGLPCTQIATTSTIGVSQLGYFTKTSGVTTFGGTSTTTLVAGSNITLSGTPVIIGSSPITISATGGSGSVSTSTVDWVIYKKGTDTVVYDTISNSEVLTTTTFGAACNYIVNAATSTFPARTDVAIRSGKYNAGSDCVISGNSTTYSPQFKFNFNASTTEVYATTGQNVFSFKDQAQVRITNLLCGLGGSGNCLFASSSPGTVQASVRESIFENIDAYATSTHTGWVVDFREDFRNKFTDFDWKFTANGYRSQNNYTNAQFINGDTTFKRGFVELCDASVGIGYVFKLDGQRGQVNQNTFSDVNGIDCEANGTVSFFYGLNATRNRVENFNVEEVGTTTEIYGSSGSLFAFGNTFSSNKYKTTGNTSGVSFFNNQNSFNNQYECWEEEIEGAVVLFRDLNTLDTQAPNAFGNFSGGVCRLNDNGGSVSMSTTTTSIVYAVRDNITGAFSYTNSIKILADRLTFGFQSGVTNFIRMVGTSLSFFTNNIERLTILTGGNIGVSSTTPTYTLSVGSSNTGTFGISTTTNGCVQATNGLLWITGTACGSGSGLSSYDAWTHPASGISATTSTLYMSGFLSTASSTISAPLRLSSLSQGVTYVGSTGLVNTQATSSIANGTGITVTNGSSAFVLGSQPTINCNTASASVFGCLSASDFSKFNSATTTFSTGLTYSGVTNAVTVNTSQNISTLSNLTTNGLVTTSGGTGALSVTANGTNGQVLAMSGGIPAWVATTTAGSGLSYNGTSFLLNTANANTWSVLQTFNYSSSTAYSSFVNASSTNLFAGNLTLSTTTAGTLKVTNTGVVWSDTSGGGSGYTTIQDEGSGLTARSILNFTGSGVNCVDDGSSKTNCTINAGAASAGGSDTQIQFNDSTSLGGAVGFIWNKTKEILGIGTTTPWTNHKVSIATSTGQNLVLLSGLNDNGWALRNAGGNLYFGTTSPTTGATSTTPTLTLASGQSQLNIGSVITFPNNLPYLHIASSSVADYGDGLLHVNATTSTQIVTTASGRVSEVGVRMGIGLWNYEGYGGLLDQLVVRGRTNDEDWIDIDCDGSAINGIAALAADGNTGCDGWTFAEDNTATLAATALTGGGATFNRLALSTVNNDGGGVFVSGAAAGWLTLATSTPTLEVNHRIRNSTATTSGYYIGFSNVSQSGTTFEAEPTVGCFFVATSTTNWRAVCKTSNTLATYVDTGVASTSSFAAAGTAYQFRKFRIQADSTKAEFFIKSTESGSLTKVAEISTNYPANTLLNAGVHMGVVSQSTTVGFDFFRLRFWWRDNLPQL